MNSKGDNCRYLSMKWVFMYTAIFDIIKTEQLLIVICVEQELLFGPGQEKDRRGDKGTEPERGMKWRRKEKM